MVGDTLNGTCGATQVGACWDVTFWGRGEEQVPVVGALTAALWQKNTDQEGGTLVEQELTNVTQAVRHESRGRWLAVLHVRRLTQMAVMIITGMLQGVRDDAGVRAVRVPALHWELLAGQG